MAALGLEILGVSIMGMKPTPGIARALEAEARESNLKAADDAVYSRRMSAVQNERAIRENELDTEIAVEQKKRQIKEMQIQAKAALMRKENELRTEQMSSDVELENQRKGMRESIEGALEVGRANRPAQLYRLRKEFRHSPSLLGRGIGSRS